jgi:hypothetical protein
MRKPRSTPYLRRMHASGHDYILAPYAPHSWWHELGRRKMVKRLEARGFPSLFGWLFVTLTVDPDLFETPKAAFEKGRDRIRRAVERLRKQGYNIKRYFVKFELTEAGWPHWHCGFDCKGHINNEDLEQAWGLGFTKIKRVNKPRDFKYLFKYVTKDAAGEGVPDWVLDYPKTIRVFQTSNGFFGKTKSKPEGEDGEGDTRPIPATLREKWAGWRRRAVVRGRAVGFFGVPVYLRDTFTEVFIQRAEQGQRPLDMYHMPVNIETLETVITNEHASNYLRHQSNERFQQSATICYIGKDGRIQVEPVPAS